MIHPDTIIKISTNENGVKVSEIPNVFQCYKSKSNSRPIITCETYGMNNPEFVLNDQATSTLLRLHRISGDFIWYEVYFKETDASVIVTSDELMACSYQSNKIGLSSLGTKMSAVATTVTTLRKIQDRKLPVLHHGAVEYYKPLIRRLYIDTNEAYQVITDNGLYVGNNIIMLSIHPGSEEYWFTRENLKPIQ